jgi:hypothetical protein
MLVDESRAVAWAGDDGSAGAGRGGDLGEDQGDVRRVDFDRSIWNGARLKGRAPFVALFEIMIVPLLTSYFS